MIKAWRRPDGRYSLIVGTLDGWLEGQRLAREAGIDAMSGQWDTPEEYLERHGAVKVFGVVTGPSSCGCDPAKFRWVTEADVKAGRTEREICKDCTYGDDPRRDPAYAETFYYHQCDIIDVCGEADVAAATYDAEFKAGVEATR